MGAVALVRSGGSLRHGAWPPRHAGPAEVDPTSTVGAGVLPHRSWADRVQLPWAPAGERGGGTCLLGSDARSPLETHSPW